MLDPRAFELPIEYIPLSGLDEYLVHNGHTLRTSMSEDPQAFERMWFSCVDKTGELLIVMGIGFYANLDACDAFAIVNHRGIHTTVRTQRRLGPNRLDMRMGPLNFALVAPFKHWRLSLGPNEFGIQFEIDWYDGPKLPSYHDSGEVVRGDGSTAQPSLGYETFGTQSGWVEIDGERLELTTARFTGSRDHHWGTRENVGGPAPAPGPLAGHAHSGEFVEFEDFALFAKEIFYNRGDARASSPIVRSRRRLKFEEGSHHVLAGEVDLDFANGESRSYTFERLGNQVAYLRCGMYGGFGGKGGTPDGNIWHGQYSEPRVRVSGETYDVNDKSVRLKLGGLDDSAVRIQCGDQVAFGIMETVNTYSHDAAMAGRLGLSVAKDD